jgi:glycosyltransferase involved in cell wall biosynthesis
MNKIISIVTPSYNQGPFISNTIHSIVSQEGDFYIDYIIQDGGSTDNTLDQIKSFEEKLILESKKRSECNHEWLSPIDDNSIIRCRGLSFRWYSGKDTGQSQAINKGFDKSWGRLVGWVNSDDFLLPGTLNRVASLFKKRESIYFGKARAIDQDGNEKWIQDFWRKKYTFYDSFYLDYTPPQPSVFFPLELYRQLGGLNENLHYMLDTDLWQRMLLKVGYFNYVPEIWSIQTYHTASKSMQGDRPFSASEGEKRELREIRARQIGKIRILHELRFLTRTIYLKTIAFLKKIYHLGK